MQYLNDIRIYCTTNLYFFKIFCFKNIGINCEIDINECAPKPCKNGKCIDGIAMFTCECDKGYEGELCDIEINECERFTPCVHGTCTGTI